LACCQLSPSDESRICPYWPTATNFSTPIGDISNNNDLLAKGDLAAGRNAWVFESELSANTGVKERREITATATNKRIKKLFLFNFNLTIIYFINSKKNG
jgi:hypothetical protein